MNTETVNTVKKVFRIEDEILIVTAKIEETDHEYISVTADRIAPMLYDEAAERSREMLEDGELWKMAVEADQTTLGLEDWADWVLSIDGEISQIDNSLYPNEVTFEGEDYIFESVSGGCLHNNIKSVTDEFNVLIDLHLKSGEANLKKAKMLLNNIQSEDVDARVEEILAEIQLETWEV